MTTDTSASPAPDDEAITRRAVVTITFGIVANDDEDLDIQCADIHAAIDRLMFNEGWQGSAELSLLPLDAGTAGE